MEVHPCPCCGKTENRHGEPFDSPQRVVGHIDGTRDAKHEGESGEDHRAEIEENRTEMEPEEVGEQGDGQHMSREDRTITSATFDGETMTQEEFLKAVDGYLSGLDQEEPKADQKEIEALRERVEELEGALNRTLGYVQALAQETGSDQVTDDMLQEGFV